MHRKNSIYRVQYCPWFQASTGDLGTYSQQMWGNYCVCVCVWCTCVHMYAQSCPTLCDPMDCSTPGSSVQRISQARVLEAVAISSSRGAARPRDQTHISYVSCTGRQILYQLLYPAPNSNTAEVSWEDKGANITNKLFCTRSQQEPAKREGKREMDKQARREEWLNNMPKMLEDF